MNLVDAVTDHPAISCRDTAALVREGLSGAAAVLSPVPVPDDEIFGVNVPTIIDLMESPDWFGPWFQGETWEAWKAFLSGVFGLPMTPERLAIWQACTQRQTAPTAPVDEADMVVGRRGGKSRIAAFIATYLACFRDYLPYLSPGEWATIPVISADAKESRTVMRYVKAFLEHPRLARRVVKPLTESVELAGRVQIEVHVARFKAVRSYTVATAICDEIAFWETSEESANPDSEVLTALRPAMGTIPSSMLILLSSPYARAGVLWEEYSEHFGKDDAAVVVWQADTATMHPHTPDSKLGRIIAKAYEKDPDAAGAEYGAQFRTDIEKFISEEAIKSAVVPGREELPAIAKVKYAGFVDPSGGTVDSMTLGVAHLEQGVTVLDCLREVRPPFSPREVVKEFADVLKLYGLRSVIGDRYGGEWPRERFRENGIAYQLAEKPKSDLYLDFLSSMNSHQVALLDSPRLLSQLRALERRRGRGGRDIVDHPPKAHDDVINAGAGAVVVAAGQLVGEVLVSEDETSAAPADVNSRQLLQKIPTAYGESVDRSLRCGNCAHFVPPSNGTPEGRCGMHGFGVAAEAYGCETHQLRDGVEA